MESKTEDFRYTLGCCGCWARDYDVFGRFVCKADMFDKNRPQSLPNHKLRHQLSGKDDRQALRTWRCEFRYSLLDIEMIQAGEFRKAKVSPDQARKVMQKLGVIPSPPQKQPSKVLTKPNHSTEDTVIHAGHDTDREQF